MVEIRQHREEFTFQLIIPETLTEEDTRRYLDTFAAALAAGEPFGMIFSYSGGRPRKERAAELLERAWLHEHRPEVARHCFGIAMIANPSLSAILTKIVLRGIGARMFGCPCAQFGSLDEARAWLRARRGAHITAGATAAGER